MIHHLAIVNVLLFIKRPDKYDVLCHNVGFFYVYKQSFVIIKHLLISLKMDL